MVVTLQQELASDNTAQNQLSFIIKRALAKLNVSTLVQVQAVTPGPGLLVGYVNVLPLVGQVDGSGVVWPATTIYNVPYFRVQGGTNAIICDPVVGDIGFCLFCDRDISSVKASGTASPPASKRRFDFADGLYFGGWSTTIVPTSYVQVTPTAVNIVNQTLINMQIGGAPIGEITATGMKVNGTLEVTGDTKLDSTCEIASTTTVGGLLEANASMQVTGTVSGTGGSGGLTIAVPITAQSTISAAGEVSSGSHTLTAHVHGGVQGGVSNTGGPTG